MSACREWKNEMLELAAGESDVTRESGAESPRLEAHIKGCAGCASAMTELRAQAARLDAALPRVADGAELRDGFETRVFARIAAGETQGSAAHVGGNSWGAPWWSGWRIRLAAAGVVCTVVVATVVWPQVKKYWHIGEPVVSITEWRSPTDSLLQTPGQELLRSTPKLGQVYFRVEEKTSRTESKKD